MKRYSVTIRTYYGSITVDEVLAENETQAFSKACELLTIEISNYAKLDSYYEYPS